ncbi:MAG: T9SS type A sorting domain-containing protein [Ignavibacteria bacterium]
MKAKLNITTILILLAVNFSLSQTTYHWIGGQSGNFTTAMNWSPVRQNGQVSDILIFNCGNTVNALNVQQQTIGQLIITNNTHVIFTPASGNAKVISINGGTGEDLVVDSGSIFEISGTTPQLGFLLKTGTTASIYGNMIIGGGQANYINAVDSNAVRFHSGASLTQNVPGFIFTNSGTTNAVVFENGSSMFIENNQARSPFGLNTPNSKVAFSNGSTLTLHAADTSLDLNGRTYSNLVLDYNSSLQISEMISHNSTIHNLTVNSGSSLSLTNTSLSSSPVISITGSINISGSLIANSNINFEFNGSTQTISGNGTILMNNANINSNVTLNNCRLQANVKVSENGSLNANNGYVIGRLTKYFTSANKSQNFELGSLNGYTPVNITFNTINSNGFITVGSFSTIHPSVHDSTIAMKRYWTVSNDGVAFDNYSISFHYLSCDFNTNFTESTDESTMKDINFMMNPAARYLPTQVYLRDTANNVIGINNLHCFGDFTNIKNAANNNTTDNMNTPKESNNNVNTAKEFSISQNYPNPFNPTTKIDYSLPVNSRVTIKLYDMNGKEVRELVNTNQTAGSYTVQVNAQNLASGVYFYTIRANGSQGSFERTLKMVLVK